MSRPAPVRRSVRMTGLSTLRNAAGGTLSRTGSLTRSVFLVGLLLFTPVVVTPVVAAVGVLVLTVVVVHPRRHAVLPVTAGAHRPHGPHGPHGHHRHHPPAGLEGADRGDLVVVEGPGAEPAQRGARE